MGSHVKFSLISQHIFQLLNSNNFTITYIHPRHPGPTPPETRILQTVLIVKNAVRQKLPSDFRRFWIARQVFHNFCQKLEGKRHAIRRCNLPTRLVFVNNRIAMALGTVLFPLVRHSTYRRMLRQNICCYFMN